MFNFNQKTAKLLIMMHFRCLLLAEIVSIYAFSVCKILSPENWVVWIFWQILSLFMFGFQHLLGVFGHNVPKPRLLPWAHLYAVLWYFISGLVGSWACDKCEVGNFAMGQSISLMLDCYSKRCGRRNWNVQNTKQILSFNLGMEVLWGLIILLSAIHKVQLSQLCDFLRKRSKDNVLGPPANAKWGIPRL